MRVARSGASAPHGVETVDFSLGAGLALFGVVSLLGNFAGMWLTYPQIGSAVLFCPYAALTTALVVAPRRHWVWYILVAVATHAIPSLSNFSPAWVALADLANVARALVAAWLLREVFGGVPTLENVSSLVWFVVIAVIVAPAVGATLGAANVLIHRSAPSYWDTWLAWFMSNALTGLTILPLFFVVVTRQRWRQSVEPRRIVEGIAMGVALGVTAGIAFLAPANERTDGWRLHAPMLVLIPIALRFGVRGASVALTAVTLAAIHAADRGIGPFADVTPDENVLLLQSLVALMAALVLCVAVVATGRRNAVALHGAILASLSDHVAILDARGTVLQVNDSWKRFQETSQHFDDVAAGDNYLRACREAAARGDTGAQRAVTAVERVLRHDDRRFQFEYEHGKGDSRRWFTMSAEALERPDGGAVLTRADITAREQNQMEIEAQRREVSHLARVAVLGQLSGALAHELRQPLTSILSNAEAGQLLLRRSEIDRDELRSILHDIVQEDRRAGQVVERLRSLLRRGEARLQPLDARELVSEVLELAHAELITRRIVVSSVVDPSLPPVLGNRVQLQQVLLNLILNACDAMSSTPVHHRFLRISAKSHEQDNVVLTLSDSGDGIPVELSNQLFEPFVTTKQEGLGLGLSIARTIIAAHGGTLWAENNPDRGASFHVSLHVATPASFVHLQRVNGPVAPASMSTPTRVAAESA